MRKKMMRRSRREGRIRGAGGGGAAAAAGGGEGRGQRGLLEQWAPKHGAAASSNGLRIIPYFRPASVPDRLLPCLSPPLPL